MRCRYQRGCLRCTKRKAEPDCWEFLWREKDETGKSVRRTVVIGNVEKYPTRDLAEAAVMGFRMQINEDRLRQPEQQILVGDLVDHYLRTELHEDCVPGIPNKVDTTTLGKGKSPFRTDCGG